MTSKDRLTLGILVALFGVLLGMKALNIVSTIFFPGWWTLFIIIPALVSIIKNKAGLGNMLLLLFGVYLLLDQQSWIQINIWPFVLPAVFLVAGISLIVSAIRKK